MIFWNLENNTYLCFMDITIITSDIIENTQVDTNGICAFLQMAQDYQNQLLMDELREEFNS